MTEDAEKPNSLELEISRPSAWLRGVTRHENIPPSYIYHINKEKLFEDYLKRFIVCNGPDGREEIPIGSVPKCHHIKPKYEAFLMSNGQYVVPIRQFCDIRVLPVGTKECFFFDFGSVHMQSIVEGEAPITTSTPTIRSSAANTEPRGTRVTIGYGQSEESPVDIVAATNRAFALESIVDENKQIFKTINELKDVTWLDGTGYNIDCDYDYLPELTVNGVIKAKDALVMAGYDPSKMILYTTAWGMQSLTRDARDLLAKTKHGDLDEVLGVTVIIESSSRLSHTDTKTIPARETIFQRIARFFTRKPRSTKIIGGDGSRSILFVPHVSFGLAVGRDLTMEMSRRNELQAINVTGTQKIAAVVKRADGIVRISHRNE